MHTGNDGCKGLVGFVGNAKFVDSGTHLTMSITAQVSYNMRYNDGENMGSRVYYTFHSPSMFLPIYYNTR
jgi:hypothetical protein